VVDVVLEHYPVDAARAKQLAAALKQSGLSVSLSEQEVFSAIVERLSTPAFRFDMREREAGRCYLRLWSRGAAEAAGPIALPPDWLGISLDFFVLLDDAPLPAGSVRSDAANLSGWSGTGSDPQYQRLLVSIGSLIARFEERSRKGSPQAAVKATRPKAKSKTPKRLTTPRPRTLFLCYRREDTQDAAGRLHERLIATYGSNRVFMDIDSAPLGLDFVDHVREQISRCSAVIVMIGKKWLTIRDRQRRRRLENADDLVRAEIATALKQNIPVVPVIVQNASMPNPEDLPEDIRLLARRNGIQLRAEQWREGVERLLKELNPVMGRKR
jgi:hypothetical protein